MNQKALLFPGQGAQFPGMGEDFFHSFLVAKETFQEADDLLGAPLSQLIFKGPEAELMLTHQAQVAIYVTSMAIYRTVKSQFPSLQFDMTAGLSLGEYSSLTAASLFSFQEGVKLVQARGEAMHLASFKPKGGMSVVLGLDFEEILPHLKGIEAYIANLNCPFQVVISGTQEALEKLVEPLKRAGAKRVLSLDVSGAFHSPLMASAKELLTPLIQQIKMEPLSMKILMNVPGDFVIEEKEIRTYLIDQVVSPTLWEKEMRKMKSEGVEKALEIGPGKTLSGMNRKMNLPTYTVTNVEDLDGISQWQESAHHRGDLGSR